MKDTTTSVTGTATTKIDMDIPVFLHKTEVKEERHTSKKWVVFLIWTILTGLVVLTKIISTFSSKITVSDELMLKVLEYYFVISIGYYGANVGQKGIYAWKDKTAGQLAEEVKQ